MCMLQADIYLVVAGQHAQKDFMTAHLHAFLSMLTSYNKADVSLQHAITCCAHEGTQDAWSILSMHA